MRLAEVNESNSLIHSTSLSGEAPVSQIVGGRLPLTSFSALVLALPILKIDSFNQKDSKTAFLHLFY